MRASIVAVAALSAAMSAAMSAVPATSWAMANNNNAQAHCTCDCGGQQVDIPWMKSADACVARNNKACVNNTNKKGKFKNCSAYVMIKGGQNLGGFLPPPNTGVYANPR